MIQIGAFSEKNKAEEFWAEAKKKNDKELAGLSPTYMRMEVGEKGVLYRVRGGMIASREVAENLCASLVKKNQVCIVVSK
jgi:cell division septation protein DedD